MRTKQVIGTLAAGAALGVVTLAAPAGAAPPRPGCGYGDQNHSHQAAPGQDDRKPGDGRGDQVNQHTAPPGRADVDAGDPDDSPRRGCDADPAN